MSRHPTRLGFQCLGLVDQGLDAEVTGEQLLHLTEAGWITYGIGGYRLTDAGHDVCNAQDGRCPACRAPVVRDVIRFADGQLGMVRSIPGRWSCQTSGCHFNPTGE